MRGLGRTFTPEVSILQELQLVEERIAGLFCTFPTPPPPPFPTPPPLPKSPPPPKWAGTLYHDRSPEEDKAAKHLQSRY